MIRSDDVKKQILLISIFCIFCFQSVGFSKEIYNINGRVSATTSDLWYYSSIKDNEFMKTIFCIELNHDTVVALKQFKNKVKCKSFANLTNEEKSIFRDLAIASTTEALRQRGYNVYINKVDIGKNMVSVGYTLENIDGSFFAFELYTVKDFVCYCLISTGSEVTKYESFSVMKTLKADGLPFNEWAGIL